MELHQYISKVLVEIVRGVEDAREELRGSKAVINPYGTKTQIGLQQNQSTGSLTNVEFEVVVKAHTTGQREAGIGIQVAVLQMGTNGMRLEDKSHLNRLRFSVPVHLPPGAIIKFEEHE